MTCSTKFCDNPVYPTTKKPRTNGRCASCVTNISKFRTSQRREVSRLARTALLRLERIRIAAENASPIDGTSV